MTDASALQLLLPVQFFTAGRGTKDTMLPMTSRFPSRHDQSSTQRLRNNYAHQTVNSLLTDRR